VDTASTEGYQHFLKKEGAKPALYVLLKKALYGTLQAALRLWKKITAKLTSMGFHINPYDSCVANKAINNKQQPMHHSLAF